VPSGTSPSIRLSAMAGCRSAIAPKRFTMFRVACVMTRPRRFCFGDKDVDPRGDTVELHNHGGRRSADGALF